MNFGMITLNQNMEKKKDCVIWVQVTLITGFIVYMKTYDIYKDMTEDFETRFDTSNHDLDRPKEK